MLLGLIRIGEGLPTALEWTLQEQDRWGRMKAPGRAEQYRAGRWLLRRLCSEATGLPEGAFSLNASGAPLAQGPEGCVAPFLSLAHSGDWVLATASEGPSGVDLERRGVPRDWAGVARHLGMEGPWDEARVLRAWTLHEARFKARGGEGLRAWRFETDDYLGCVLSPAPDPPAIRLFCGGAPLFHDLVPDASGPDQSGTGPQDQPRPSRSSHAEGKR